MQITININGAAVDVLPQPEQVGPTEFRADMNVKAAIEALENAYIDEALRRVGEVHGKRAKAAKLLGFNNYQSFQYWMKRRARRAGPRNILNGE